MTFNNTHSTPAQCASLALFLSPMTRRAASSFWIDLLCIVLPYTLFISWFCAVRARDSSKHNPRPFFGTTEKWFCACMVFLGINMLLFLLTFLAIQTQMFCSGGPISEANYIAHWIFQTLLVGGTVGTAALCWWNSLMAVRGREDVCCNWWVFKWEAYLILSPFIAVAMGVVLLVKGQEACEELKFVKRLQEWRSARSHPMKGFKIWKRGLTTRTWWGRKERASAPIAAEAGFDFDLERRYSPSTLLGKKGDGNYARSLQSPAPPPYASDDPLS